MRVWVAKLRTGLKGGDEIASKSLRLLVEAGSREYELLNVCTFSPGAIVI
jgi:hypothetical protein